jgi:hypothetical protein
VAPENSILPFTTLDEAPERTEELVARNDATWPEYLLHGDVRNWSALFGVFAGFQLLLLEKGSLIAAGLTVPFAWDPARALPETIDEIVYTARWPLERPGVLCALAALASPGHRGRGLGGEIVRAMCRLARRRGLAGVLAPVRPTRKDRFPNERLEEYVDRRDAEGRCYDPWIRVHEELGGRRLGVMHRAMTVRGTVAEWERWTGSRFPDSGSYAVAGALVPVTIDRSSNLGEYIEPNVWYYHDQPVQEPTRRGGGSSSANPPPQ